MTFCSAICVFIECPAFNACLIHSAIVFFVFVTSVKNFSWCINSKSMMWFFITSQNTGVCTYRKSAITTTYSMSFKIGSLSLIIKYHIMLLEFIHQLKFLTEVTNTKNTMAE